MSQLKYNLPLQYGTDTEIKHLNTYTTEYRRVKREYTDALKEYKSIPASNHEYLEFKLVNQREELNDKSHEMPELQKKMNMIGDHLHMINAAVAV